MIVLIDTSWLYCRFYYVNENNGYVDPAMYGSLYFLELLYSKIDKYKKIYLVLDGNKEEYEKTKLLSTYKEGRESTKKVYKNYNDFLKLCKLFSNVEIVRNTCREADDVISYLAYKLNKEKVIIHSGDKDLIQLTSLDNVCISNSFKNGSFKELTKQDIFEKFKNSKKEDFSRISENVRDILKYRVFKGDASDNIKPPIPRLQDKFIKEIINVWKEDYLNQDILGEIILRLDNQDLRHKIASSFDNILINYQMMDLMHPFDDYKLKTNTRLLNINMEESKVEELLGKYKLTRFKKFLMENELIK